MDSSHTMSLSLIEIEMYVKLRWGNISNTIGVNDARDFTTQLARSEKDVHSKQSKNSHLEILLEILDFDHFKVHLWNRVEAVSTTVSLLFGTNNWRTHLENMQPNLLKHNHYIYLKSLYLSLCDRSPSLLGVMHRNPVRLPVVCQSPTLPLYTPPHPLNIHPSSHHPLLHHPSFNHS